MDGLLVGARSGMRSHVVIGAGPAGLTAAWELTRAGEDVVVLEADREYVGGLSRTVEHAGNRFDIGGHRFYTKSHQISSMWQEMLPNGFLEVDRLSRIYYDGRYFQYPLNLLEAMRHLGVRRSARVAGSYAVALVRPRTPESSFEDWVVNRFGRELYETFFRTYTEKVWGMPCTEINKDWAAQRIRGLDLRRTLKDALLPRRAASVKTLIKSFIYAALGPGQLWEAVRDQIVEAGGAVLNGRCVMRVAPTKGLPGSSRPVTAPTTTQPTSSARCRYGTWSPPSDPAPPPPVRSAAAHLRFRDFLTVALVIDRADVFPDNWIYVHDPTLRVGRIQNTRTGAPRWWRTELGPASASSTSAIATMSCGTWTTKTSPSWAQPSLSTSASSVPPNAQTPALCACPTPTRCMTGRTVPTARPSGPGSSQP